MTAPPPYVRLRNDQPARTRYHPSISHAAKPHSGEGIGNRPPNCELGGHTFPVHCAQYTMSRNPPATSPYHAANAGAAANRTGRTIAVYCTPKPEEKTRKMAYVTAASS